MNIYCYHILKNLDLDDNKFASNYQEVIISHYLQNIFGCMYIRGKKTLIADQLFIASNIKVNEHMDASGF